MGKTNSIWEKLGDISSGRANLGQEMPVLIYRLFEFSVQEALKQELGKEMTIILLRKAGEIAGIEYASHELDLTLSFNDFVKQLRQKMLDMKIGVLRIEKVDEETKDLTVTIAEDLDCSGLPILGESVCYYDEGFLSGILSTFTNKHCTATEIDCWAKGDRVCRFEIKTS